MTTEQSVLRQIKHLHQTTAAALSNHLPERRAGQTSLGIIKQALFVHFLAEPGLLRTASPLARLAQASPAGNSYDSSVAPIIAAIPISYTTQHQAPVARHPFQPPYCAPGCAPCAVSADVAVRALRGDIFSQYRFTTTASDQPDEHATSPDILAAGAALERHIIAGAYGHRRPHLRRPEADHRRTRRRRRSRD